MVEDHMSEAKANVITAKFLKRVFELSLGPDIQDNQVGSMFKTFRIRKVLCTKNCLPISIIIITTRAYLPG
eukprot:4248797-Amphidinium_carterae.2